MNIDHRGGREQAVLCEPGPQVLASRLAAGGRYGGRLYASPEWFRLGSERKTIMIDLTQIIELAIGVVGMLLIFAGAIYIGTRK